MTAKEIHDCLLSLLIRGLGVWMLYTAYYSGPFVFTLESIYQIFVPAPGHTFEWQSLFILVVNISVAVFFILGAPPLLKWATRK